MLHYRKLLGRISLLLSEARKKAVCKVNDILVTTYWRIGREIIEFEQKGNEKAEYGSRLLAEISKDLQAQHGKGFSKSNVYLMRQLYLKYPKFQTLSGKLSWSHYAQLLSIEDDLSKSFYERECLMEGWSVRELDRQINSMLFERIALSKDKKGILALARQGHVVEQPSDLVKDPYILDFLGLESHFGYTESTLEQRLIQHLKQFILELGKGFMFVERQKRITIDNEHFFVDLVFYNRIVKCFVLIELKVGKLTHKDLGQLQMYVHYFDRTIKNRDENPTLGLLLCADKKEAVVKYTLPEDNKQIFSSRYRLILPDKKELENKLRIFLKSDDNMKPSGK
ncbi:MAG: PDDEXK nuclease domain-containing protein [Candidatus Woesearchaeota archaeon]